MHAIAASSGALDKSARLASEAGVEIELEQADLANWSWPQEAYDYVVAIFIQFADPVMRAQLFERMKRSVKPGGLVLLQGYRPEQVDLGTGGPPQRDHMYTRDLLLAAFHDFDIVHLEEHDTTVREGRGHSGVSALIDLIARRPVEAANR